MVSLKILISAYTILAKTDAAIFLVFIAKKCLFVSNHPSANIKFNAKFIMPVAAWQTWGVGLVIVTISAFAAPVAILAVPLFAERFYERIMSTLVALGIGALSGSIMYIMVPQSMNATNNILFIERSSLILGALYFFFLADRFMQYLMELRKLYNARKIHLSTLERLSVNGCCDTNSRRNNSVTEPQCPKVICHDVHGNVIDDEIDSIAADVQLSEISNIISRHVSIRRQIPLIRTVRSRSSTVKSSKSSVNSAQSRKSPTTASCNQLQVPGHQLSTECDEVSVVVSVIDQIVRPKKLEVAAVAYMIIFGSSANNFVDGMSNGVAFSSSFSQGLSVGIACIAQQFPQELGMLAVLTQSGLGLKKAILLDMIPAVLSYLGFITGALLQKSADNAAGYVFAISSGMYLYVLLGCLIPEMREAVNELIRTNMKESFLVSALQFFGCASGVLFMYAMARHANCV